MAMLTDAERELIAAAVDGDLTPDREVEFHALMSGSPAAATLFAKLNDDRSRLRALPRRPAPDGLSEAIAGRIARLPYTQSAAPVAVTRSRKVGLGPYVLAASLLLAIGALSFLVSLYEQSNAPRPVARKPQTPDRHAAVTPSAPEAIGTAPRVVLPQEPEDTGSQLAVRPRPVESRPEPAPLPRTPGSGDLVGSRPLPAGAPLQSIEAQLPVLASVAELDRPDVRDRLRHNLARDPAFRLDLFAKDVPRAAAELQTAAAKAGLAVSVELTVRDRLKKKLPTVVVLYTESLAADDIVKLTDSLAGRARTDKKPPVFTSAHLTPAQESDERDLRDLLGVTVSFGKRPRPAAAKNVASGTATAVAAAIEKGAPGKPAILLTYHPVAYRVNPALSKEVKAFRDRRGDTATPTGVPLLIVIRPALIP